MNYEILEALGQIAREKNVDKELVIETLEAGIVSAARRRYGQNADIQVRFDEGSGGMSIEYVRKVVDDLTDEELEIEIDDARVENPDAKVGQDLRVELTLEEFGRNAIQAAKQVVVQRVREAERENVYQNYHNRVNEVLTGTVQQVNRGNIIVNLGRAEALLPWREQIRREQYRQGDTIRAMIIDVQRNAKGPQIILSRASGAFLVKLFEQEVPEILEGIVTINAVAREAGGRAKIAVSSNEYRVDPVGACVGMKGSRVQSIVRELSGERIDIVPFSEDPIAFVTKALSPAKILQTIPNDETKHMKVIVTEDQLSLAIGKSGQNARLAAKLTGWEIDLVSEEDFALSRGQAPKSDAIPVDELEGLGPKTIENLITSGFESVQDIVRATIEDLINVPGVGDVTAQRIYLSAVQHIEAVEEQKALAAEEAASAEKEAQETADAAIKAALEIAPLVEPEVTDEAAIEPAGVVVAAAAAEVAEEAPAEEAEVAEEAPAEEPEVAEEAPAEPVPVAPSAPPEKRDPSSYLDDIEAMESELSAGWEGDDKVAEGEPGKGEEIPADDEGAGKKKPEAS
jgi:N utilization substance protein A